MRSESRFAQDLRDALRALVGRADEVTGLGIVHLERDPADSPGNHWANLPQRFRHRQPEPFGTIIVKELIKS